MRLDFNILWIEDQPEYVAEQEATLRRVIEDEGFDLGVIPAQTVEEASKKLSSGVFNDHIDLILVDFKLGKGPDGDTALHDVRRSLPFREIIFYSATQAKDLRQRAFDQSVDGIYCAARDELVTITSGVFQSLIKKVLDIDHSRGIVMGATSDIDHVVHDCISIIFEGRDEKGKEAMLGYAMERIEKHVNNMGETAKNIQGAKDIAEVLGHHQVFTAADRLQLLRRELQKDVAHAKAAESVQTYYTKVLPARNDLAHKRILVEGFIRRLVGRDGKEVTIEEMKALRTDLRLHRSSFDALASVLRGVGGTPG